MLPFLVLDLLLDLAAILAVVRNTASGRAPLALRTATAKRAPKILPPRVARVRYEIYPTMPTASQAGAQIALRL